MCCVALRINGATFADSSWTLHLFVKRLFVLWCHWWSELSPNRNKGGVIWLRSLGSCRGYENAACHGSHYIDNHTQLFPNLGWVRDLIQYWGQMTAKLGWFKMLSYVSLEKWHNWKKATCKLCQAYANSVTNLIFLASLFSFWVEVHSKTLWPSQCCSPASFRMELCVAKVFTLGWIVPYLCFWMFFRMWKTGKLTGKLSCRYSGCQRKWSKSRQDTVPHAPSLSHVMKTVKISVDPAFITVAWNFHWNKIFNFIGFSTQPHDGFTSRIGCVTDDHGSDLSLTTCFPPVLCLWLLCFHGRWNTLAGVDGFGKFNCDGADELCNSTHMNELTGSRRSFTFQHSVPLFCAGVYFTGSFSIILLLFLPVDVHGWAKNRFPFHLERVVPFLPFLGHSYKLAVFYRQYKQL